MFEEIKPDPPLPISGGAFHSNAGCENPLGNVEPREESGEAQTGEEEGEYGEDAELANWKEALRRDFEQWLASIEESPAREESDTDEPETPDLYSFYQQLAASTAEARKANRRTAEAISQWGETLVHFEGSLTPLRETLAQFTAARPKEGELARGHCLVLIELLDRLQRIGKAFSSPPRESSWWTGTQTAWRKAWETQRQAFEIVVSHLEELLKKEGVARFETLGQAFDPVRMMAVGTGADNARPAHIVLEEFSAGYERRGELLRPAQVKVNRHS